MPKPRASSPEAYVRKRIPQLIREGYPQKQAIAIAYAEARRQWPYFKEAEESPTREPWIVFVRTSEPAEVERRAGMRGQRTAHGVGFALWDDQRAASLARTLTRAGYIVTYGPEASVAAETGVIAGDCDHAHPPSVPTTPCKLSRSERAKYRKIALEKVKTMSDTELSAYAPQQATEAPFASVERDPKLVDEGKKYGNASNARAVYDMVQEQLNKESQEVFLVIPVDLHGDPLCPPVEVARGQRDRVSVDASDVMRPVIAHNASGFVVIHNHPSGLAKPSDADRRLTKTIQKSAKTFEPVVMIDHVIIGRRQYYSIVEDKHYKVASK